MAIYRGPGGAGDATADATNAASIAEGFADAALISASAASSSAATASNAATAASAAQTAAEAAQAAAETAETNAETAETNAETAQAAAEAAQAAAETAQSAAETAETNAETAQAAAEAAQLAAETAETNAETAETGAVAAQVAAESARDATLAAYDNFDDRYLGAKTSNPTLDNDGNALVAGALYFNSTAGEMRLYTGSAWVAAYVSGAGFLAAANNLSDVASAATARQNLDLEIGVDVQAYDADTAKYDDTTANFVGTLQNGGHTVLTTASDYLDSADIGASVQAYDADTAKTDVAQTFTAKQTFGTTTKIEEVLEKITVSATAATGTINFDALSQGALYYTTNASGNWTLNVRGDSGTSLNTMMATGESLTVVFLVTQGSTAYYNSAFQVDGSSVTPKWQGGSAPTAGNASSIDAYTYVIVKTGSATFTVFASIVDFA